MYTVESGDLARPVILRTPIVSLPGVSLSVKTVSFPTTLSKYEFLNNQKVTLIKKKYLEFIFVCV